MTAKQALGEVVGSNEYLRLRYIIAKASIGESDTPERCREAIRALTRSIKRVIRKLWRELPDSERQKFKNLLQGEMERLRKLLNAS